MFAYAAAIRRKENKMIYTVFPKDKDSMPQDFETYQEAKSYGDDVLGKDQYQIASTDGECV